MAASWKDLWDQSSNIAFHTDKGIEFLEKYGAFLKERCQIEVEYAKQLRGLTKRYHPKKKEEEDYQFTYARAFLGVLQELSDMAGQHEVIAENFKQEILKDLGNTCKDLKEQRKMHLTEAYRLQQHLDVTVENMYKTRRDYAKAFKEAESAQLKYEKAEANMDISRAELEKSKNNAILRSQQAEEAKNTYALQLQKTNNLKNQHYDDLLPSVFEKLRTMDETRIAHMQRLIRRCVEVERSVYPIIQRCLDGMVNCADKVEPPMDSRMVVDKYRTGWLPPEDYPFEDLGAPDQHGTPSTSRGGTMEHGGSNGMVNGTLNNGSIDFRAAHSASELVRKASMGKTRSGRGLKSIFSGKKTGDDFKEDFSDYPPSQRVKKLQQKIQCLEKELERNTAERDGLLKMQVLYKEKPHMGDIHQVEAQMAKVNQELDFLTGEISKFKNYLTEASSQVNMPITAALSAAGSSNSVGSPSVHGTRRKSPGHRGSTSSASAVPQTGIHQRSSFSEDSLSSGSSMGHQHSHTEPNLGVGLGSGLKSSPKRSSEGKIATEIREGTPPQPTYGSSTSPESGIGGETSQLSFVDGGDVNDGSLYNECAPLPILGTGTALYTFDGCSDGTIPMREGEELLLIEKDEGDGWTRVRKVGGTEEEGFVPTSYLEMKFYPT